MNNMKKFIYALFFIATVFFSACGDRITEEYNVNSFSKSFIVYKSEGKFSPQWEFYEDGDGRYFYCSFRVPELTDEVLKYGVMNCYFRYFLNEKEILSPLPFSDFFVRDDYQWEEQITVEYEVGYVTFIMKYDDQTDFPQYYDNYEFVLRLLW
jgi:hypothetical protein